MKCLQLWLDLCGRMHLYTWNDDVDDDDDNNNNHNDNNRFQ